MEPKTKKRVLVVGSILAIGAIAWYLLRKRKNDSAAETLADTLTDSGTTPATSTKVLTKGPVASTTKPIVKVAAPTKKSGVPIQTAKAQLVSARDLLAGNPNGATQKAIYAQYDNLPIYNANMQKVRTTKKNEFLGVVSATENINGNYWFRFVSGGIVYKMPATGVLVKIN